MKQWDIRRSLGSNGMRLGSDECRGSEGAKGVVDEDQEQWDGAGWEPELQ